MRETPDKPAKDALPKARLSTEAYKGVRDFYPEEMAVEQHIFGVWKKVAEQFGYERYDASILEPTELYRNKTSEEIVNEQSYTFTDRGDRQVTLRPEMTPTVARMVAARKRELGFPLRWYSIPNLFRYEQPQRGRLREFWQLNVDIFGIESIDAEIEIIQIASQIMRSYGFKDNDFEIRLNNRKVVNYILKDIFSLDPASSKKMARLIDKKEKLPSDTFIELAADIFAKNNAEQTADDQQKILRQFMTLLNSQNFDEFISHLPQTKEEHKGIREIKDVIVGLQNVGVANIRFDQTIMRGFDYYTGIVFEVFDLNPENRRSVFGGGRYDDLLSIFGSEADKVPAVGFGAGDVITQDMLETYKLVPKYRSNTDLYLIPLENDNISYTNILARNIREQDETVSVAIDYSGKKLGDKIKTANKQSIPFVAVIGEEEQKSGSFKIKHLETGKEVSVDEKSVIAILKNNF